MVEQPDAGKILLDQMFDLVVRVDENRSGHIIAELAIITLLIDAKIATIPQVCERLELIQSVLPERHQTDGAKLRTRFLTEWLRGHMRPKAQGWTPQVIEGGKDES